MFIGLDLFIFGFRVYHTARSTLFTKRKVYFLKYSLLATLGHGQYWSPEKNPRFHCTCPVMDDVKSFAWISVYVFSCPFAS